MSLPINYTDDILDENVNTSRKYLIRDSAGNILYEGITIEEITTFVSEGSTIGARDINATNNAVNELSSDVGSIAEYLDNSLLTLTRRISSDESSITTNTKNIATNKSKIDKLSTVYKGTLAKGSTLVMISTPGVTSSSCIEVFTSIYGVAPTNVSVNTEAGHVSLAFEEQSSAMTVGVAIR